MPIRARDGTAGGGGPRRHQVVLGTAGAGTRLTALGIRFRASNPSASNRLAVAGHQVVCEQGMRWRIAGGAERAPRPDAHRCDVVPRALQAAAEQGVAADVAPQASLLCARRLHQEKGPSSRRRSATQQNSSVMPQHTLSDRTSE